VSYEGPVGRTRPFRPRLFGRKTKPKMVTTGQSDTTGAEVNLGPLKIKKERTTFKQVPRRVSKRMTA